MQRMSHNCRPEHVVRRGFHASPKASNFLRHLNIHLIELLTFHQPKLWRGLEHIRHTDALSNIQIQSNRLDKELERVLVQKLRSCRESILRHLLVVPANFSESSELHLLAEHFVISLAPIFYLAIAGTAVRQKELAVNEGNKQNA